MIKVFFVVGSSCDDVVESVHDKLLKVIIQTYIVHKSRKGSITLFSQVAKFMLNC